MRKKGSILIISLWVISILAVFAIGLGNRALLDLRLANFQKERLEASYLAKAGMEKGIAKLEEFNTAAYDSLADSWSTGLDEETGISAFDNIELEPGSGKSFSVRYLYDRQSNVYLCMSDEERRINLNTASEKLLMALFKSCGLDLIQAEELVKYIRIWRGDNDSSLDSASEAYKNFKKYKFSNPEELTILLEYFYRNNAQADYRIKAQEIFARVTDYITVYPLNPGSPINVNTCGVEVLSVLAQGLSQNQDQEDLASSLAAQIIALREAQPDRCFQGSEEIKIANVAPGSELEGLLNNLVPYLLVKSDYFRIESTGNTGRVSRFLTAVYDQKNKNIVYWHEK